MKGDPQFGKLWTKWSPDILWVYNPGSCAQIPRGQAAGVGGGGGGDPAAAAHSQRVCNLQMLLNKSQNTIFKVKSPNFSLLAVITLVLDQMLEVYYFGF